MLVLARQARVAALLVVCSSAGVASGSAGGGSTGGGGGGSTGGGDLACLPIQGVSLTQAYIINTHTQTPHTHNVTLLHLPFGTRRPSPDRG